MICSKLTNLILTISNCGDQTLYKNNIASYLYQDKKIISDPVIIFDTPCRVSEKSDILKIRLTLDDEIIFDDQIIDFKLPFIKYKLMCREEKEEEYFEDFVELYGITLFIKYIGKLAQKVINNDKNYFVGPIQYREQFNLLLQYQHILLKDLLSIVHEYMNVKVEIGMVLDCVDTEGIVCQIMIKNVQERDYVSKIHCAYFGWSNKWNEWIDLKSGRLFNHNTITNGYLIIGTVVDHTERLNDEQKMKLYDLAKLGYDKRLIISVLFVLDRQVSNQVVENLVKDLSNLKIVEYFSDGHNVTRSFNCDLFCS